MDPSTLNGFFTERKQDAVTKECMNVLHGTQLELLSVLECASRLQVRHLELFKGEL